MSVYVDAPIWRYGRMVMCHMFADTYEELHAMADKIGVARRWFQDHARLPHYDVCKSKRILAIKLGAIEATKEFTVEMMRKHETKQQEAPDGQVN